MLNTNLLNYSNPAYPTIMKGIAHKIRNVLSRVTRLWKPAPNEFNKRYAEKFANPDHCQWQGGRLLSQNELDQLPPKL